MTQLQEDYDRLEKRIIVVMNENKKLKAQLEVAKEGLIRIRDTGDGMDDHDTAVGALAEMKRLEDE